MNRSASTSTALIRRLARPARPLHLLSLPAPTPITAPAPAAEAPVSLAPPASLVVAPGAKAWVGVVSRSHVQRGVAGGFAQLCHGKGAALRRMMPGDFLVYYSPATEMKGGTPLKTFTALGRVTEREVYSFDMGEGFIPYRREIDYLPCAREAAVRDLASELAFVRENASWGMLARRGHFEISLGDFAIIARAMGVTPAPG